MEDESVTPYQSDTSSGPDVPQPAAGQGAAGSPSSDSGTGAASTARPAPNTDPSAGISESSDSQGSTAPAALDPKHNWGGKVMSSILGALGGQSETQYSRDPDTGKLVATEVRSGPGQQWKKIIAGGLTGMAAASQVGRGPGQKTRALGAGIGAGMERVQADDTRRRGQADVDYDMQQKATLRKAQTALLNQQLTESSFNLGRARTNAQFEDATRENEFMRSIANGGESSRDLGVISKPADGDYWHSLLEMHNNDPSLIKQQAQGNIIGVPHVSKEGQIDGMHYAVVTPEWKSAKLDQDETFYKLTPPKNPKDAPKVEATTIKAGSMTNGDFWNARMASEKEILDWYNKQSEDKLRQSEITKNTAETGKANAETTLANQQTHMLGAASVDEAAAMLVEGQEDPSQLSKRAKEYQPTINAANRYSIAHYGVPWDPAQATIDYHFATNTQTQNTLKYLNSLTGADNKTGNLGKLVDLSNQIKRTEFPAINNAEAWAKLNTGDAQMAAYQTAVLEVSEQIGRILSGGQAGSTDYKLKAAQEILDKKFSKGQIVGITNELRSLLANRKTELIGDNRYLRRQFQQAPANASNEVVVNNKVVGHTVPNPDRTKPDIYVPLSGSGTAQ